LIKLKTIDVVSHKVLCWEKEDYLVDCISITFNETVDANFI